MEHQRPMVSQQFLAPSHKGSEARVTGVDFVDTYSSLDSAYSIINFVLNARNQTTFPRLSEIAGVWRRYYFNKIRFHLFGIASATQRGYVGMSSLVTDDLATQITPTTEVEILNQENVAIGRPWSYVCHDVNLSSLGLKWYTTDTSQSASEFGEAIGRAFLGIPQTTTSSDIDLQVYVEYDVEFAQRIAGTLVQTNVLGGSADSGGGETNANLLGTSAILSPGSQGFTVNSSGVMTFTSAFRALLAIDVNGGSLGALTDPPGWTLLDGSTSTTSALRLYAKDVTISETVGPFANASGTITDAAVYIATIPSGSLFLVTPPSAKSLPQQLARMRFVKL